MPIRKLMRVERVPGFFDAPGTWGAGIALGSASLFALFVAMGEPQRGTIAMFGLGSLALSMAMCWKHKRKYRFWIVSAVFLGLHATAIYVAPGALPRLPGLGYALLAGIDIALIAGVIQAVCRFNVP